MQDIEYLKSMYPNGVKMLQEYVSEACDRMDYANSPMYDEFPDQLMVNRLCDTICDAVIASEGMEGIRSMWNIRDLDPNSVKVTEISREMEDLMDGEDTKEEREETINSQREVSSREEVERKETEGEKKKEAVLENILEQSTVELALEPLETQELRFHEMQMMEWDGRFPMSPDPERPPMGPGSGRAPMGFGSERPPMGPGSGRAPMDPGSGRAPMGPGSGRPPMGPGPVRPPQPPRPVPPPPRPPQPPRPVPPPPRPPQPPRPVPPPPRPPQPPRPVPPPPRPPQPPRPVPPPPRPPYPPRPVPPPTPRPSWLRDMIKVLLLNEMFNRRCARGICR